MRKLMWFSIGFGAACALGVYCLPDSWMVPSLVFLGVFAVITLWKGIRRTAFFCFGCALGLLWFLCFQQYYLTPARKVDGETQHSSITITDYSYETTYGAAADGQIELSGKTYQIRIYLNSEEALEPGDTVTGSFRLRYTAPGGTEEATYHSGKGILLLGYQQGAAEIIKGETSDYFAAELRWKIKGLLRSLLPEDVFPFAQALLLGDGTELDYATDTAFKISGIRHIIAVSGLHASILYALLSTLTLRRRYLTGLIGIPTLFLFAAVAGFTPSVTRACIMVGLMILAQMANKEYDSPTALGFAALVMLVQNPSVITSVSFQLSVGCVAGILLFQKRIDAWLRSRFGKVEGKSGKGRLVRWFSTSVSMTLSAMSLTTPLSAWYFGTVSLIGVVTNLLTLWVVNLIFNGLMVLCLLSLASVQAAAFLAAMLAWPMRFVLWMAKCLASVPLAAVYTASSYITAWLVFVYLLLGIFLLTYKKRPAALTACAVLGLCMALLASWAEPLVDDLRVTVLDVGQGQCILLQSEGRTFLIDCGGDNGDTAADTAAGTLLSQGISRLDGVILTHGDLDHSGGLAQLLSRVDTDLLFLPSTMEEETAAELAGSTNGKVVFVSEDLVLTYGDTEMTIFGPTFASESNENSLCVLFTAENCDILVTGDRGRLGELLLMRQADLPQVELLIAGHHGSKYSVSEELLEAIRPETAIISVGADNPYGHPAQEVLDRLAEYGVRVYRTDENGTIIYRR